MTYQEILRQLQSHASETYKVNVVRMGIPNEYCIGVSTMIIRKIAKKLAKNNELAWNLWQTNYHEAKLLATLLFEVQTMQFEDIDRLMADVISWDLCDHLCKELIMKSPYAQPCILAWVDSSKTYYKRACFTLIASSIIHNKTIDDETIATYLALITKYSQDQRDHVKKAVAWALKEIGKKDFDYHEKALLLAYHLKETGNKVQIWIANNVIKELENMVKVNERQRLLSAHTKMGQQSGNK